MHKKIAIWLHDTISDKGFIYQNYAATAIREKFGEEYVYISELGTLRLDTKVLYEFNKLNNGNIQYDSSDHCWRKAEPLVDTTFSFNNDFDVK